VTPEHDPDAAELPDTLRALLSAPQTWEDPAPGLRNEIRHALLAEQGRPEPGGTQDQSERPTPAQPDVVPLTARAERHTTRPRTATRRPLSWGLVAACVSAVLGAGLGASLAMAMLRPSAPDFVVTLAATQEAPGASGEAEFRDTPSGFQIDLDVRGLAPSAAGTYYQAWLKNTDGNLVTIGTFHAREGGEDIVLWSAVDPRGYPTLTVTRQLEGAGADSSGQVVLTGTVP